MTTLESDLHDADIASLQLELAGRRFSESWTAPAATENRVRRLAETPQEARLSEQLEVALWDQLDWQTLPDDEPQRQPLVESYIRSLNQLDGFCRDVDRLIRAACLVNLEFRQAAGETHEGARDTAMNAKLDEMLAAASAEWLPARNILDGPVVSQDGPALSERLESALRTSVLEFTTNFFDLLARLVDRQLIGLVEWLPNQCCSYHFFKQVVIQENEGAERVEPVVRETVFDEFIGRHQPRSMVVGRRTTVDARVKGKHYHRLARHEHAVINAIRTSIGNSRVVLPPQVKALLQQVPEWLYPFVSIIDGDIVRERIIERETKVENWQDVVVRDEPIFGCEPGVIIGPYVLTGWGPREVQAEQARRETIRSTEVRRKTRQLAAWRWPMFGAAAATMALLALVLLFTSFRGQGGGVFALLAAVAAIGAAWQSIFDFLSARGNDAHAALAAHWFTASVACQMLIALWFVARWFTPLSWVVPLILGAAAVVCYAVGRRFI